ncbi:hypothetical protein Tco_0002170 [Tanacetum coccineum]
MNHLILSLLQALWTSNQFTTMSLPLKESWAVVEEYAEENEFNRNHTKKAINNTMEFIEKINKARVDERSTLLKSLNRVSQTLEADSTLKATIISESLKEDLEFNQRLLKAAEGFTNIENTQVTMQSDIASINIDTSAMKEIVTEMFIAFKGLSSSTPLGSTTMPTVTPYEDNANVRGEI